ncbi:helix-turn-helix domain-containing protein [Natronorubrum daqingense]|uniref:Bacterio-opsin activator n=1 Tax=Natronorubrum daqingense TaxID=588898 RepID=A0A1N6YKS4_9EURY|nr:helix-turn-helix domain-containing protein [Natronorubrum daqingense]APX95634.1 bacterio-opsin activator [Natronorubrum daqingense]SIR15146.1 Predicted DNA binding protein, contains HTH domain [Natronorubrum daqingense]
MGFIAEIQLVHDNLALAPTIARYPDVTFRREYEETTDDETFQFVSVFSDEYETLESAMEADHTVSNPTRVATFENRAIYRMTRETDLEIVPPRCAEGGVFVFTITSGERGWIARVHLPDRETLSAFRAWSRERNMSFRVTQLYDLSASDAGTYFLTEQQHEILLMAYYTGYFDIPRGITQDGLADRLNVSDSAVSQRIRRAVSELIGATLEDDRTPYMRI